MPLSFPLKQAFLALPLENDSKEWFTSLQNHLRSFDFLRLQKAETPHVTLQFWKELTEIEYQHMRSFMQKIAQQTLPFSLAFTEPSTFGSRGRDHVLFLQPSFSEELARLKKSLPWPNERPFHPHLTIARISHPEKFAVKKKEIFKRIDPEGGVVSFDRIRFYACVDDEPQTPVDDFLFQSSSSPNGNSSGLSM